MRSKWNYDSVKAVAKKHKHREEFFFAYRGAYNWAQRHGLLDDICSHMSFVKKVKTFDEVMSVAKQYEYKKDFIQKEKTLYRYASSKGWLSKIVSHMKNSYRSVADTHSWDKTNVLKVMKQCKSRTEFRQKYRGAVKWCNRYNCLDEYYKKAGLVSRHKKYSLEDILKVSKQYKYRNEFKLKANGYYASAQSQGLLDKVCSHMDEKCIVWNQAKAKKVIKKYSSIKEIRKYEKGLYFWLLTMKNNQRKVFDKLIKHLEYNEQKTWTKKDIIERANNCKTLSEFFRKERKAYNASRLRGREFHEQVISNLESVVTLREKKYQEKFVSRLKRFLDKKKLKYTIREEYKLPKADKKKDGYLDVYLDLGFVRIPIELKHDDSFWTKKHLKEQASRYNRKLRKRKNMLPLFIVSPKGKYGISEKEFFQELNAYV